MVTFKPKKYQWDIHDLKKLSIRELVDKYKCDRSSAYHALRKLNIRKNKYVFSEIHKKNISENHSDISGSLNPNYKNGATLKKYHCIDCNKRVKYRSVRCSSCHNYSKIVKLHKNSDFLKRSLMGFFRRAKCSGKSKIFYGILNYFYPNKFQYVGDGTLIIDRYTPDFSDGNKNLIEFFGEYWHKIKQTDKAAKRDKRKLKVYKKFGYNCLVVWEKELEDLDSLKKKIDCFLERNSTIKTEI